MNKVLDLLKDKNFYLEKFLEASRQEGGRFKARHFENVDTLYNKREQILLNIQSIDKKIKQALEDKRSDFLNLSRKSEVSIMLEKIKNNVQSILEEDLQIISFIEDEKSKLIKEISKTREGRKILKSYRASPGPHIS